MTKRLVKGFDRSFPLASMSNSSKPPTLQDVARDAGVSCNTASVVLNGSRSNTRVSEATRQRVLDAAESLRYVPNAMARGLAQKRTKTIGVLFGVAAGSTDYVTNPYMAGILQGVLEAAGDAGHCVTIFTQRWVNAKVSAPAFRDGRTDGVLVIAPPANADILPGLAALGIALAAVACEAVDLAIPSADVDNWVGVEAVVRHLMGLGHRKIGLITGECDMSSTAIRTSAFCSAMKLAGIEHDGSTALACKYSGAGAEEAFLELWQRPTRPTAIFACNDAIAAGVARAARDIGVRIPDELSLVGFDDVATAAMVTPPLTTIRQPLQKIGIAAAEMLLGRIAGESFPANARLLPPELIVRESTGPAFRIR